MYGVVGVGQFKLLCLCRTSLNDFVVDCSGARQKAYSNFHTNLVLDYVGRFGNSDPFNVSQWLGIINETVEGSSEVCDETMLP